LIGRQNQPKSLEIFVIFNLKTINMEDLQSVMACLDDISSKIGDGMYLAQSLISSSRDPGQSDILRKL
jgi:hypothetical protein